MVIHSSSLKKMLNLSRACALEQLLIDELTNPNHTTTMAAKKKPATPAATTVPTVAPTATATPPATTPVVPATTTVPTVAPPATAATATVPPATTTCTPMPTTTTPPRGSWFKKGLGLLGAAASIAVIAYTVANWPNKKVQTVTKPDIDNTDSNEIQKQIDKLQKEISEGSTYTKTEFTKVHNEISALQQYLQLRQQQPVIVQAPAQQPVAYPQQVIETPPVQPLYQAQQYVYDAACPTCVANRSSSYTRDVSNVTYIRESNEYVADTGVRYIQRSEGVYCEAPQQYYQERGYQQPQCYQQPQQPQCNYQPRQRPEPVACPDGRGNGPGPTSGSIYRPSSTVSSGRTPTYTTTNRGAPSNGGITRSSGVSRAPTYVTANRGSIGGSRSSGSITRPSSSFGSRSGSVGGSRSVSRPSTTFVNRGSSLGSSRGFSGGSIGRSSGSIGRSSSSLGASRGGSIGGSRPSMSSGSRGGSIGGGGRSSGSITRPSSGRR